MEEKFLYHIWDANHLNPLLKTVSGKSLKVLYQGQFNTNRGPDFVNAIINLDGEDLQGAVEIHLNTQDWNRHAHQEDHFFNTVVLHVVHTHSGKAIRTIKENGEMIEILELKDQLSDDIQKLISEIGKTPLTSGDGYCDLLSAIDKPRLEAILATHGKQRFMGKVRRFNASLSLSNFDQILYEGMMEAAGYDKNKFNLLQLAQSIPFSILRTWAEEGMDTVAMVAILCECSGLLGKSRNRIEPQLFNSLTQAFEQQGFYARKLTIDWQLFRIRPANHPLLRIVLLAEFLHSTMQQGLLNCCLDEVEANMPNPEARYKRFAKLFQPHQNSLLPQSKGLGRTVVNNIYLNIYLPIMFLYAEKHADTSMADSVMESWNSFGALAENYITRFMGNHINAGQVAEINRKSLYQQGLIDIYYRYCRYHLCEECCQNG